MSILSDAFEVSTQQIEDTMEAFGFVIGPETHLDKHAPAPTL